MYDHSGDIAFDIHPSLINTNFTALCANPDAEPLLTPPSTPHTLPVAVNSRLSHAKRTLLASVQEVLNDLYAEHEMTGVHAETVAGILAGSAP